MARTKQRPRSAAARGLGAAVLEVGFACTPRPLAQPPPPRLFVVDGAARRRLAAACSLQACELCAEELPGSFLALLQHRETCRGPPKQAAKGGKRAAPAAAPRPKAKLARQEPPSAGELQLSAAAAATAAREMPPPPPPQPQLEPLLAAGASGRPSASVRAYAAGPLAKRMPSNFWAPLHSELVTADGSAREHEKLCGCCQTGGPPVISVACSACPAFFHKDCLGSFPLRAADWRCPVCEVRAARALTQLLCNFCGRGGTREAANRLLVALRPSGGDGAVVSHKWCAEFASGGGGTPYACDTLWAEYWRSRSLKCALCGGAGAASGCARQQCLCSYHIPCVLDQPGSVYFCNRTPSLACARHASALGRQEGPPRPLPRPAPRPL